MLSITSEVKNESTTVSRYRVWEPKRTGGGRMKQLSLAGVAPVPLIDINELSMKAGRFFCKKDFIRYVMRRIALEYTDSGTFKDLELRFWPGQANLIKAWISRGEVSAQKAIELERLTGIDGLIDLLKP